MNSTVDHPNREALLAFELGRLEEDQARQVEEHIAACEACCQTLLDLSDDTFVELVRRADAVEPTREELPPELADHPRYRIESLLGRGGMGHVYKAHHKLMNRTVALKVINHRLIDQPQAIERFRQEVLTAARLSHPNIVSAHDAEQTGNLHFLVMEYVDGIDLAELVKQRGPLPASEACGYIRQAAEGLQHAHQHGMVHRDIKPQNLMVSPMRNAEFGLRNESRLGVPVNHSAVRNPQSALVKILDFGLARFASEAAVVNEASGSSEPVEARITAFGTMIGTPDYLAPEQSRDAHSADIRADIYALGCTLYFLLTGKPPFPDGTVLDKVKAHQQTAPPLLHEFRDDLPMGLETVVQRMLAKAPAARYQTPAEVAIALGPFAEPPRQSRRVRRWLVAASLAALLLVAAVLYVQLGKTTLKFEIDDPSLAVRFSGQAITIDNDGQAISIKPGEKQTFVVEQKGVVLETNSLVLRRSQKVLLKITAVQGRVEINPSDATLRLDRKPSPSERLPNPDAPPSQTEIAALLADAVLVMDFEKDTFYEQDGQPYVRDLSGQGNNARCERAIYWDKATFPGRGPAGGTLGFKRDASQNVEFRGGGLIFPKRLLARPGSFTIAGWFYREPPRMPPGGKYVSLIYSEMLDSGEPYLELSIEEPDTEKIENTASLVLLRNHPTLTKPVKTHIESGEFRSAACGRWFFAAWTYDREEAPAKQGSVRLTVNESSSTSQANLDLKIEAGHTVIGRNFYGLMDDLLVFPRALSTAELIKLYAHRLGGGTLDVARFGGNPVAQQRQAAQLGLPVQVENSLISFRLIPSGEFQMGSRPEQVQLLPPDESWFFARFVQQRRQAELPQHRVEITRPFYLGAQEVTVGQFRKFVAATGYVTDAERDGRGYGWRADGWSQGPEFDWQKPGFEQTDEHPVCNVSWVDANAFCRWLDKTEGGTHRLPAEAEWEYACRAGTITLFSTGDDVASLQGAANLADQSPHADLPSPAWAAPWNDSFRFTAPVGRYRPNAWGLHDMHGNVWEWCQDTYDEGFYRKSIPRDPLCTSGNARVFRGGGFDNWPGFLRSADRYSSHSPTLRTEWAGFRVVREIPASQQIGLQR